MKLKEKNQGTNNRKKGEEYEIEIFHRLVNSGIGPTQRTRDGFWDNRLDIYEATGDGGIDIITETDGYIVYTQCKNWENKIGSKDVRTFWGALTKFIKNKYGKMVIALMVTKTGYSNLALLEPKGINIMEVFLTTTEKLDETIEEIKKLNKYNLVIERNLYTITETKGQLTIINKGIPIEIKNV